MEFVLLIIAWMTITAVWGVAVQWFLKKDQREPRPGGVEPRCGQCGYVTRGLPGRRCPECGSDLRIVGVDWK